MENAANHVNFSTIKVGDEYRHSVVIRAVDVDDFCKLSGDTNPLHLDSAFARELGYKDRVVYGALSVAYLSRVIGALFPGPGTVWLGQQLRFESPVYIGDRLEFVVRVKQKNEGLRSLSLTVDVQKVDNKKVLSGEATVGTQYPESVAQGLTPRATVISGESLVTVQAARSNRKNENGMVAIVTGGGRGIGAAIASLLASRGIRVAVNYLSNREAAETTVREIVKSGGEAVAVAADISAPDGARTLFDGATKQFGQVDIVVNNAGLRVAKKDMTEITASEMTAYFSAYVGSAFELVKLAAPGMKERAFGRIINVLTSALLGPPPAGWTAYVVAKSALEGLSRSLAVELAPYGVTCNMVSPSLVPTEAWSQLSENQLRALALRNPTRRLASAQDVAVAVAFLASVESQHINGVNIPVTGGESLL
jgi:3-oxoacyl-[acyl-carrier protein] reductase